jgi:hypothetical protein
VLAALAPGPGAAQFRSDWETRQEKLDWKEAETKLPAYPRAENLIGFFVSAASDFRFFVDSASVSAGPDGVVRYTLVARSPAGAENVTYEGIRCATSEYRIYAIGRRGEAWGGRATPWRVIELRTTQRWHNALYIEYFCPSGQPIRTAQEGVDALRRGGHPEARAPHLR